MIDNLPPELILCVISKLEHTNDILNLGSASKILYQITNDEKVWKRIVRKEYALVALLDIDGIGYKKFYFDYIKNLNIIKNRLRCKICGTTNNTIHSFGIYNMKWWIIPQKIWNVRCSRCNTFYVYKTKYNALALLILFLYASSPTVIPFLLTYVYNFYEVGIVYQLIITMIYSVFLFKFLISCLGIVQRFMLF